MSRLTYIQFHKPVSVPKIGSIERWSRDTDEKRCPAEEKGAFVILRPTVLPGSRCRVPMTNVAYILDEDEPEPTAPAKGGKP